MVRDPIELIEDYCAVILPILRENGIPGIPSAVKISVLADKGEPMVRLQRMHDFLEYLDEHNDKITAAEFRDLTIELMEKYPE